METYTNCMDCPNHSVEADPDPHDWFCDDDEAVLCKLSENVEKKKRWWDGSVWEFRPITWSCRPHHKRKECDRPEWCPLLHKEEPDKCICEGNFRKIIKETELLFGKTFKDPEGDRWFFQGVLWGEDDFYYMFENNNFGTKYCSCCASIEQHGFTLIK